MEYLNKDDRFKFVLMEYANIYSIMNMNDQELRSAVLEQMLIWYLDYKKEQLTLEEFMSSLAIKDCIDSYRVTFNLKSQILQNKAKQMGITKFWRIWMRVYDVVRQLIDDKYFILINDDPHPRKKNLTFRFFDENAPEEVIKHICQQFMDECGTWWDGYIVPDSADIIMLTEEGKELLANNSIDDIMAMFTHEIENGEITNKTSN